MYLLYIVVCIMVPIPSVHSNYTKHNIQSTQKNGTCYIKTSIYVLITMELNFAGVKRLKTCIFISFYDSSVHLTMCFSLGVGWSKMCSSELSVKNELTAFSHVYCRHLFGIGLWKNITYLDKQ